MSDIKSGQWVSVKITKEPPAESKKKTLIRLFRKDPKIAAERGRLAKTRPVTTHQRGGRQWADRPPQLRVVKTIPGASCRIFASVDVLRDLRSLTGYVDVKPA
jgi:hypothetical protein